jgi:hypothetical protein
MSIYRDVAVWTDVSIMLDTVTVHCLLRMLKGQKLLDQNHSFDSFDVDRGPPIMFGAIIREKKYIHKYD